MDENEVVDEELQDIDEESSAEDVPAELQGLSDEVVKETMAEAYGDDYEEDDEVEEDSAVAEPDSVNKQSTEQIFERPKQKIPYERFKEVSDKNKAMKAEIENLKAEMERMRAGSPTQPAQTQAVQQQEETKPTQPQFTADQAKAIKDAIRKEAMQTSGLSQEEVDSIPYMDEDDDRIARWKVAESMATNKVMSAIEYARQEQAARTKQFMENHQKNIDNYNAFVKKQMSDPNFEAIKAYATGAYFENLAPEDRPVIADAYARIERNVASPQDMAIVKRFFKDAKSDFNKGGRRNTHAAARAKQSVALPRADKVEGSAASVGSPSVAALERMLNEKSWDDIPDEYKAMLKGL